MPVGGCGSRTSKHPAAPRPGTFPHNRRAGSYTHRVVLTPTHTTPSGEITVWCHQCSVASHDAGLVAVDEVVLRCDACGETSRIQRVTPDDAVDQLTGMQPERAGAVGRMVPGDWTVAVTVMWRLIDTAHTDDTRRDRHHDTLDRWG